MQASYGRAIWRAALFLAVTILLVPPYLAVLPFHKRAARAVALVWYRLVCWMLGLRIRAEGLPAERRPTLFVSNHVSYLDIPVLATLINGVFVAKAEVANWPLLGFLARIGRTIFIERTASQAGRQRERMSRQIAHDDLILFPEGTSGNGREVLPFKSALFSVAKHDAASTGIWVQPVSVAYVAGRDGRPLTGDRQDHYAWFGDAALVPHLSRVFTLPGAEVRVTFHAAVAADSFATRKELARHCEGAVATGVADAHRRMVTALEAA